MKTMTFFSNSAACLLLLAGLLAAAGGCDFASITREHGEETIIYVPEDGPVVIERSAPPAVVNPVREKTARDQGEVSFALSAEHVGVWEVYDHATEESRPEGVGVNGAGTTLTLYKAGGVPPGTYYVTVTEPGKLESTRVALSVADPGQSVAPRAERTTALRRVGETSVTFTLGAAQSGDWKAYADAAREVRSDVSVVVAGTALTLSKAWGALPETFYITVTEAGKEESAPLALTVKLVYRVEYSLNGEGGTPPAAADVEAGLGLRLPAVAPRAGYVFSGWWTEAGAWAGVKAGNAGAFYTPPGDITLYANWEEDRAWDGAGYINLTTPSLSRGTGFSYANNVFTILDGATVFVGGTTTSQRIVVAANARATVTLDGASIDRSSSLNCPFNIESGANVTLRLLGENTLTADISFAANYAGIHVTPGSTLTITSADGDGQTSGTLTVKGSHNGAAIGGILNETGGTITIAGGTVTAIAGPNTTAIGGGDRGSGQIIIITGGIVDARGSNGGASIGNGSNASGKFYIEISGGNVTANAAYTNDSYGAGIGGGRNNTGGTIKITGGTVYAYGSSGGAGIGGGDGCPGGEITILGGMVTAQGGANGAGIGGGQNGGGGTVTISGASTGTATGGSGAPGVGPGAGGSGGTFNGGAWPGGSTYSW